MVSSSSPSPLSFGLVGYNSDSSMQIEEPQQVAAAANSSREPSPDPGEGCSGLAQEALEDSLEEPRQEQALA